MAGLERYWEYRTHLAWVIIAGAAETPYERNCRVYSEFEAKCIASLVELLQRGELIASGIETSSVISDWRSAIHPSLWDILSINVARETIESAIRDGKIARRFEAAEIFEPQAVPLNISEIPRWLETLGQTKARRFTHDADYRHVEVNGKQITLSDNQAKIVEVLHEAALTDSPWMVGKQVIGQIGGRVRTLREAFKRSEHFDDLIEHDGRSRYRLKNQ